MSWCPVGKLFTNVCGIEIAGIPARFAAMVNRSSKYSSVGSFDPFESNAKVVPGEVGVRIKSHS